MNEEQLEGELAGWFSHRREMDAAHAPAFAAVWTGVRARHERTQRRAFLWRVSAIAATLLLAGILVSLLRGRSVPHQIARLESNPPALPWRTTVLAAGWRAPTDFLLTAPEAGFTSLAREVERWNQHPTLQRNRKHSNQ